MVPAAEDLLASLVPLLPDAGRIYLAYSGGLDSTVLLHAAAVTLPREKLTAIHVNHGLSPASGHWQEACAHACDDLGVRLISRKVRVEAAGKGVEQAARHARYRVFEALLGEGDLLLMGHHLDDRVETVLYRLLRGSGPAGLAGMPAQRALGQGRLLRPLLDFSRMQLEHYARAHCLEWVEDESNARLDFDRNYLRQRVVPAVAARWPDYRQRIARTAANCDSAALALQELAELDLASGGERRERLGDSISLRAVSALSRPRQENLLRHWAALRRRGPAGHRTVAEVLATLLPARADSMPVVRWENGEFRRFNDRLYLLPPLTGAPGDRSPVAVFLPPAGGAVPLMDGMVLRIVAADGGRALAVGHGDEIAIGYRRGGEYCRPADRSRGGSLKKLLNEYRLEPWLRDRIPLIYINGELAAVAGLFVCREHCCGKTESGIDFKWEFLRE